MTCRVNAGDEILYKHFKEAPNNANCISPKNQNELISISEDIVMESLIRDINKSPFLVLADETTHIDGIKQQFYEYFLKFIAINDTGEENLASTIIYTLENLNLDQLRGQGYDGATNGLDEDNTLHRLLSQV